MSIDLTDVTCIDLAVTIDIGTGKLMTRKQNSFFCVSICFTDIAGIDSAVTGEKEAVDSSSITASRKLSDFLFFILFHPRISSRYLCHIA